MKPTSSTYSKLKIIDWELVTQTDPTVLRQTRDPKTIERLINSFMNANALFADPSFCPPELVLKLFSLMQTAIGDLIQDNQQLVEINKAQKKQIKQLKRNSKQKESSGPPKYRQPKVVFQCQFCSKLFESREFLSAHVERRHSGQTLKPPEPNPHTQPRETKTVQQVVAKTSQDLGPFKDEVAAMLDHFDTMMKQEEIRMRSDFSAQFRRIEESVNAFMEKMQKENVDDSRFDASYSADAGAPQESIHEEEEEEEEEYEYEEEIPEQKPEPRQYKPVLKQTVESVEYYTEEESLEVQDSGMEYEETE